REPDGGLEGGVGFHLRYHQHAREIRRQAARARGARMGALQGERLARVPQLPRVPVHGLHAPEQARRRRALHLAREGRQDLHRLPQGHRPPTSRHGRPMTRRPATTPEEKQQKTEEWRTWLFFTVFMAPILAVLAVSG